MSNKEIFICLAVMFFLGYLVGRQIERHITMKLLDELHNELLDLLETHKKSNEQMRKEIDNYLIEHEYKQKEDSDD